ncbi:MAG: hypothetical protein LUD07_07850 [Clostridiales bacterium]|nr:hypothetical protein [Clostridiales bacterium]
MSQILIDYRHDLETYKELECPADMIQKQRILVDALTLLESSLEEKEE